MRKYLVTPCILGQWCIEKYNVKISDYEFLPIKYLTKEEAEQEREDLENMDEVYVLRP